MSTNVEEFRMGHLVRTAAVWKRLVELGANDDTLIDFDFHYTSRAKESVRLLKQTLDTYSFEAKSSGLFKKNYSLSSSSGPITWTEERLILWVDYLIGIGNECGCEFDGCGASLPDART